MTGTTLEFTMATPQMIDELIRSILKDFESFRRKDSVMDRALATRLLMIACMDQRIAIDDAQALNEAVSQLMRRAHNLHEGGVLTVEELMGRIAHLPPATPVFIDYLQDGGWQNINVLWEKESLVPVVQAFSATDTTDEKGKRVLHIHAHY